MTRQPAGVGADFGLRVALMAANFVSASPVKLVVFSASRVRSGSPVAPSTPSQGEREFD
jgi:hypothetical protein